MDKEGGVKEKKKGKWIGEVESNEDLKNDEVMSIELCKGFKNSVWRK